VLAATNSKVAGKVSRRSSKTLRRVRIAGAEVAVHGAAEIATVLLPDWAVKAEVVIQGLHLGGRGVGTQSEAPWVPRHHPCQDKHQDRKPKQHKGSLTAAAAKEREKLIVAPVGAPRRAQLAPTYDFFRS